MGSLENTPSPPESKRLAEKCDESGALWDESGAPWDESATGWDESAAS